MPDPNQHWVEDLRYAVQEFDAPNGRLLEVIAKSGDYDVALAAYWRACLKWPGKYITLSLKAQVLKRSDEGGR